MLSIRIVVKITIGVSSFNATTSVTITQPNPIVIVSDSLADNGSCNGSAWIAITGGTPFYSYLWTGGSTTDTIKNKCAGTYCCLISDAHGCKDSTCVTINLTTDIKNILQGRGGITVYPNPCNGTFELGISNYQSGMKYNVEIYNVLGEKVYSKLSIVHSPLSIDLRNLPNGIYFYRIIKEDSSSLGEGKLIIQK